MKKHNKIKIPTFLIFVFSVQFLSAQLYNITRFTQDDGLPSAYIYDIAQTKSGNLILATGEGLAVFDGFKFTVYDSTSGLSDRVISAISTDSAGTIAVGQSQSGINISYSNRFVNIPATKKIETPVSCMLQVNKKIYFGTRNGKIGIIENNKVLLIELNGASLINKIIKINNLILIATDNGIYNLESQRKAKLIYKTAGINFTALCLFRSHQIIAGTDNGQLIVYKVSENTEEIIKPLSVNKVRKSIIIKDIINPYYNKILIATWGDGIYSAAIDPFNYELKNLETIGVLSGLENLFVTTLFKDMNDNIWIGTFGGGLYKFNNDHFRIYNKKGGLVADGIRATLPDKNNIFLGLEHGLEILNSFNNDSSVYFNEKNHFVDDMVNTIAKLNESQFLIGTENKGLFLFDSKNNSFTDYFKIIGMKTHPQTINHINVAENSIIYLSINDGLIIYKTKTKAIAQLTTLEGMPHNNILFTFLDSKNRLWFAAQKSASGVLENDSVTLFKDLPDYKSYNPVSFSEGLNGDIFIATNGDGIYKYHNGAFTQYTINNGLGSNYVIGLAYEKTQDALICAHHNGLSVLFAGKNKIEKYTKKSIMKSCENTVNSISIRNHKVYFGTQQGMGVFSMDEKKKVAKAPVTTILKITINGKVYSGNDSIINLPYGSYDISFDYIGIELSNPAEVV